MVTTAKRARSPRDTEVASKEKFLKAMDEILVEEGYRGASIRKIAARAGTSIAILHRHWTNKEALLREALSRHFDPIHQQQQDALDQIEALAGPHGTPAPEAVLQAFFEPAFASMQRQPELQESVYCCAVIERSADARAIVLELVRPTAHRTMALLRRSAPQVSELHFMLISTLVFSAYSFPLAFRAQLITVLGIDAARFDEAIHAQSCARALAAALRMDGPAAG